MENDDVQAVLASVALRAIAEAWCRWMRTPDRDFDDPNWWAAEFFMSEGWSSLDDDTRLAGILALVDAADTDSQLAAIGAGVMWGSLADEDPVIDWLEDQARRSPKFRVALSYMDADRWRLESDRRIRIAAGQRPPDR